MTYECRTCGSTGKAWAIVWNGEHYVMVEYNVSFPVGPYGSCCIGKIVNELNALRPDPRDLIRETGG